MREKNVLTENRITFPSRLSIAYIFAIQNVHWVFYSPRRNAT